MYFIVKYNDFKFSKINLKLFPMSMIFVFTIMFVSNCNLEFGYYIFGPAIILWALIGITRQEMKQGLELVKNKIRGVKS